MSSTNKHLFSNFSPPPPIRPTRPPLLLLATALLSLAQCQKSDPDPASQLPEATQTGANQVGCLLNGQP